MPGKPGRRHWDGAEARLFSPDRGAAGTGPGRAKESGFSIPIALALQSRKTIDPPLASSLVARGRLWGQIALDLDPNSTSAQLLTLDRLKRRQVSDPVHSGTLPRDFTQRQ